jgi:hypothetical protein
MMISTSLRVRVVESLDLRDLNEPRRSERDVGGSD